MTDYEQALALAKAGQLEKAQALLLASDHPKADALLEKVNKAIAARGAGKVAAPSPKAKPKGLDLIGILIVLGILVLSAAISGVLGNMLWNSGSMDASTVNIISIVLFILLMILGISLQRRFRN